MLPAAQVPCLALRGRAQGVSAMPRPSSIDLLPESVRESLHAWLRDPGISQGEATARTNALLEELGIGQSISRQAVNRYDLKMRDVGAKLQQSREVAKMWIAKLGAQPQGQVGQLINEMLRTLALDVTLAAQSGELDPEDAPEVAKMLKDMAIAMERLEKAASENVKREEEIRQRAAQEAAETAETRLKAEGMSKASIAAIKRDILGIA